MSSNSDGRSDRIAILEQRVAELEASLEERAGSSTRRRVLSGLAGAGILGMGAASAETGIDPDTAPSTGVEPNAEDFGDPAAAVADGNDPSVATLVGSADASSPANGLASRIEKALSDGARSIDVHGAWKMGGDLSFSSAKYAPTPINLDCTGAYIEYHGSGWCITNDNSNDHAGQRQGGILRLHGGFWQSRGTPRGWFRGIDLSLNEIYPTMVRAFNGASYRVVRPDPDKGKGFGSGLSATRTVGSAAIQLEEGGMDVQSGSWAGGSWNEGNKIGGRFHGIDTGIRGVASRGNSFQGNFIDRVQFSATFDYGFDLSGNWMECKFDKPEMTTPSEGAALLRHNGNMGGSVITAPEIEDASADLDNYHYVEIGPFATEGPQTIGGFWTSPSDQSFIRDPFAGTDKQPPWGHFASRTVDGGYYFERYSHNTSQRFGLSSDGFEFSTSNDARNWTARYGIDNSGNVRE